MSFDGEKTKQPTAVSELSDEVPSSQSSIQDPAWTYLDGHRDATAEHQNIAAIKRKVDWRIVPLMFCCYTMQFLDKVIYNYAAVMGIQKDLKLQGNDFSNIATFFFVAYLAFEIPNVIFLQKIPAATWMGINVMLWGVATAAGAAAKDYQTLLVSRVFLGIFEATISPSLMLISSQWYTKSEQAPRFSFWYLGLGLGQIIGGLVSFGFQNVTGASLEGWRIMFLVLGIVTVIIGAAVMVFLPNTPMQASWLTDDEKVALLKHVSVNQTGIKNKKFRLVEIVEGLLDVQIWLITLAVVLLSVSSGVVTTYSSTLIRNMGYSPKRAALMNMPSGVVSIFFTLLVGYGIRKQSHRWAWIIICIIPGILGGALMSFLPPTNRGGILAGIYLVNAIVAPLPVYYNWITSNVSGHTKRAYAAALVAGSFSIGNIIGPQTFQVRDAPVYRPAKLAVMGTQAGCAAVTVVIFLYYMWANKRRDAAAANNGAERVEGQEGEFMDPEVWKGMTDKKNKAWRYVY